MVARLELRVAAIDDAHVLDHTAINHLAIRRLDEAELVDARKARKRRDESNVRTFRRLNRTDATVVRRVHVSDLEACTLARESARPQSRKAALVRNLRERIGLIHELRELA